VFDWLRRLFASGSPEEDAVRREEFGLPARDELDQPGEYKTFSGELGVETAEDGLDEFKAPRDPAP
jgi:hypothetical protein